MNKDKPKLELINNKGTKGYTISNIKEVFGTNRFAIFEKWMYGQTVGIYKSKPLVFQYDLERFLEGLPVID